MWSDRASEEVEKVKRVGAALSQHGSVIDTWRRRSHLDLDLVSLQDCLQRLGHYEQLNDSRENPDIALDRTCYRHAPTALACNTLPRWKSIIDTARIRLC